MASTMVRRPLPALISLLALLLLTGVVWWRVINRDDSGSEAAGCPTPTPTPTVSQQATLPAPASVPVQVLNSTKRAGLAGKVRTTLQQVGFQVPSPAGNDKSGTKNAQTAQIRFGPAGRQGATLLRYYFPGATLTATSATNAVVVVALGEKYTGMANATEVAAALKGDHLATASASPPASSPTAAASSVPAGC